MMIPAYKTEDSRSAMIQNPGRRGHRDGSSGFMLVEARGRRKQPKPRKQSIPVSPEGRAELYR